MKIFTPPRPPPLRCGGRPSPSRGGWECAALARMDSQICAYPPPQGGRGPTGYAGPVTMKLDILSTLNAERAARRAVVLVTQVASGPARLVKAADVARDPLKDVLEKHLRSGKSGMEDTPQGKVFLTVHVPAPRLVAT